MGSEPPEIFKNLRQLLNPLQRLSLKLCRKLVPIMLINSTIEKMLGTELLLSYKSLKLKLRVLLAGRIVAMVTYCPTKLTAATPLEK